MALTAACAAKGDAPVASGGSGTTVAAPTKSPIKLGVVLPLSGPVASIGTIQNQVIQAWVKYLNEVEGGIDGHPVVLSIKDDGGDAARAVSAIRALADEKVVGILGVPLAASVGAATTVVEELKLSMLTVGAVPSLLRQNPKWVFQMDATSGSDAEPTTTFVKDLMQGKSGIKVALAPHDSPSSQEWKDAVVAKWAPKNGLTITASPTVPLASADVTAQAQEIVSSKPDVVILQGTDATFPVVIAALRRLGFTGPVVVYHGAGGDQAMKNLKDENVYVMRELRGFDDDRAKYPGLDRYLKVIEKSGITADVEKFGQHSLGTLTFLVAEAGLRGCADPCDAAKFNETLNKLKVDTGGLTLGPIEFSPTDRQGITSSGFYHLKGGKIVAANSNSYNGDVYTMVG